MKTKFNIERLRIYADEYIKIVHKKYPPYKGIKKRHQTTTCTSRWLRLTDKLLMKLFKLYRECAQDATGDERKAWVGRLNELLHYLPSRREVRGICLFSLRLAKRAGVDGITLPDRLKKYQKLITPQT